MDTPLSHDGLVSAPRLRTHTVAALFLYTSPSTANVVSGLSEDLMKDAQGSLKVAVEALSNAASMTQNVPYLGIISSALTAFLKAKDVC